jgi:MYXO-CTERM domain-containing protein
VSPPPNGTSYPCPYGAAELTDTGFEGRGATPWLYTAAPVAPGSTITLTFGIFDSGDGTFDSTVLIDDFRWSARSLDAPMMTVPEPSVPAAAAAAGLALAAAGRRERRRRTPR